MNTQHEIILPHETDETFNTKEVIQTADYVIAEASEPAIGLGIELGWADTYGTPIICIYRKNAQPSGSLKFISKKFIAADNLGCS